MEHLKHVIPTIEYKEQGIDYIKEHQKNNSKINGSGGLDRYIKNYEAWLEKLEQDRQCIPNEQRVPAETYYLVREEDNRIVGMINIRLTLNARLQECGGHIGYGIRPTERKKGYNKINLYLALICCQNHGIENVYLDSDIDNPGSYKTMEALGGIRIAEYTSQYHQEKICRYVINVNEAIQKYKEIYEPQIVKRKQRR